MNRRTALRLCFFAVTTLVFPLAAHTQDASDPFAQRHAELMRAADEQIEALRAQPVQLASEPLVVAAGRATNAEQDALAAISDARVERAAKRLLALGLDATRIFAEEGVPLRLLVLAEIESGFDPAALSPKGARGLWQLMPETARRFGLRVDNQLDERLHASRSTRAAARYLRALHLQFGDWPLALAAYNAGEQRITQAIDRAASRSFALIASQLPSETRRYVPAVLGAHQ